MSHWDLSQDRLITDHYSPDHVRSPVLFCTGIELVARMPRATTSQFCTELNLNSAGGTVPGRRYCALRTFILEKVQDKSIISHRQAGDILWRQLRTEVFHVALDSLIMDVLKKAAESWRNAQLNSDDEQCDEDEGAGRASGSGSRGGRDDGRPQPTLHKERPWQYPQPDLAGDPPVLHFAGAQRSCLSVPEMNVTPNAADQIELIDDDHVNAWLRLSPCTTLTITCFLHRDLVPPSYGGDAVRPNTPLDGGNRSYLDPGQFEITEFYTGPDSDSDVADDAVRREKRRKAFPRSHSCGQKRILSND
ncbi:hypothetical protein HOY82DRAFT_534532 [Tuber indicum]|nr:hypothetical protein HOY82DRAFT_534532 [Tuber indicum]